MIDDLMGEVDWQLLDLDVVRQHLAPTVGAWMGWGIGALVAFWTLRWAAIFLWKRFNEGGT